MNDPSRIVPGALPWEHLTRQMDLLPVSHLDTPITVVGCGSIGSFVVLTLAKMGFWSFTLYDPDVVDTVNLSCQFYRPEDIGKPKVEALADLVEMFTRERPPVLHPERFEGRPDQRLEGVVISALDSMAARRTVYEAAKKTIGLRALIDPRMGALESACYVARPQEKDWARYEKTLHSDAQAVEAPCTAKATLFTVLAIASHVSAVVRDVLLVNPFPSALQWSLSAYDHHPFWPLSEGA